MLQSRLALLPNNAVKLSDQCALVREEGQLAIFNSAGVIFMIVEGDRQGMRTAQGMLCALALAKVSEVATAFDVARSTVRRNRDLYLKSGGGRVIEQTWSAGRLQNERRETCRGSAVVG